MRLHEITIAFCTLCVSASCWSSEDGDLWILPTAIACLAQYPELSNTRLGTSLINSPKIQQHINKVKAVLASNPWRGRAICDELMPMKRDPQRDDQTYLNNMRDRHVGTLKALAERLPDGWSLLQQP